MQGRDPLDEKQNARDRLTTTGLIEAYGACAAKRASTQYADLKRIDRHLLPLMGGLRADEAA